MEEEEIKKEIEGYKGQMRSVMSIKMTPVKRHTK